ncbi:unnamed protein product [Brassicogethes aeneus]|uniref:ABC transporter domain-containing protein n=1 Tax=Brassicogethes aeneus TaxID=1431903 RepID=A0A9P0AY78_BRAAE|nr:unnamed protein product [Brassicogethes aeneus]
MLKKGGIVLWKHYLIRKRHWFLTLIEVILPVLIFLIVAYCRAKLAVIKKIEVPAEVHLPSSLINLDTQLTKILYSPSNNVTDDIIHRVQEKLEFPTSNVFSFPNEDDLVDFYVQDNIVRAIGIIFEEWESPKFKYTLRVHEESAFWNNDKLFSSEVFNDYQQIPYISTGFLTVQQALDNVFIEKNSNKTIELNINLKGVPFPPRIRDVGVTTLYSSILPYVTIFSFLLIIPAIVQRVVEEKKSGIKELQKMVGLKSWMIWFGWFMHGMIPALVSISIITILMKVSFWGAEYPPIEFTNGFIYFIFLVLYCISTIFFCFLLSTFTSKPTFSMVFTILIWIFSYFIPDKILLAYGAPRFLKICLGIFPNVALDHGYKIMQNFEQKEIGIQWSNIFELSLGGQNEISMFTVFIIFIADVFIFIFLTMYIDNINPGSYGIRQSVFFPIKKIKKLLSSAEVNVGNSRVEKGKLLKPGIQLINLSKNFGSVKAVDDMSMSIDKDQITVLLGHNGAGKTTVMHMMTGMIEATEGAILIDNLNVRTDMDKIRRSLGLCPQHNLLFQDLTVLEHLLFFAMLKGVSRAEANEQAERLTVRLHLHDKKHTLARTLSGGMKRKLCLGMAVIGDPKVLILDEPTSGMDPESRREVWDMLKRHRESKTILITTHFLEEADVLGDKIAIMSHGKVLCHDTPLELKKKYNTGYHLSLSLKCSSEDEKENIKKNVLSIINEESVNASDVPAFGNTICINLEIENKSKFPSFLAKIEDQKQNLKIENMSLTLTKLEDVFLKSMDTDDTDSIDCKKIITKDFSFFLLIYKKDSFFV